MYGTRPRYGDLAKFAEYSWPFKELAVKRRFFSICLISLTLLLPCVHAATNTDDSLLVAAGAGYRRPVTQLLEGFTQATGIRAEGSFGNMKQVETQARQNPDISVLIGDRMFLEPMDLAENWQLLGVGKLVLVTAKGQTIRSIEDLRDARFKRIALPDRERAVYGRAATLCLERLGLTSALADRLLYVQTVPQVGAYLATAEVDAGFVNLTEAMALRARTGQQLEAPQSCYTPIELSAGVIKGKESVATVNAFVEYLKSPAARQILARHGM